MSESEGRRNAEVLVLYYSKEAMPEDSLKEVSKEFNKKGPCRCFLQGP
jgi:hypothetical protein